MVAAVVVMVAAVVIMVAAVVVMVAVVVVMVAAVVVMVAVVVVMVAVVVVMVAAVVVMVASGPDQRDTPEINASSRCSTWDNWLAARERAATRSSAGYNRQVVARLGATTPGWWRPGDFKTWQATAPRRALKTLPCAEISSRAS
jgi:hypothetical protein